MLSHMGAAAGEEHWGSMSVCSMFVFTSLRLVRSCADDCFMSVKTVFIRTRVSLLVFMSVRNTACFRTEAPTGLTSGGKKSLPIYKRTLKELEINLHPGEPAVMGSLTGENRATVAPSASASDSSQLSSPTWGLLQTHRGEYQPRNGTGTHARSIKWLALEQQPQEKVSPP